MNETPIERAAEACLLSSSLRKDDWAWDASWLTEETREVWRGYARASLTAALDKSELINVLEDAHLASPEEESVVEYHVLATAIIAHILSEGDQS